MVWAFRASCFWLLRLVLASWRLALQGPDYGTNPLMGYTLTTLHAEQAPVPEWISAVMLPNMTSHSGISRDLKRLKA